ncbi:MAG: TetR/AcrR family transcriptional regulator [Clostridiales bacterium]|nr:TetR/AcrR family transcriptional regulator [Clostridiales bacterium]
MGKAQDNKQNKLERLMDATFMLFSSRGMARTSISDITAAAGIAKGTFYLYFKDKDDIRDALVARMTQGLFREALRGQEESDRPFADKLIHIVDSFLNQLQNSPLLLRFLRKNLNWSLFRSALRHSSAQRGQDYMDEFYRLTANDPSQWEAPQVMLFTIIELVGSTCYSVVVEHTPVDLVTYKPYLYRTIRSIVQSHQRQPEIT